MGALKRPCKAVYAAILPKASKPFLYLTITLPPRHVDVNVHPTKREVSFLNQEALTLLPGALPVAEGDDEDNGNGSQQATGRSQQQARQLEHKLVRTDARNQAGSLHAFVQPPNKHSIEDGPSLAATRAVRQWCNPAAGMELTSVQELPELASVLQRFAHFKAMNFSAPAPLRELLLTALDDEERSDRWQESEGRKDKIASLNMEELLQCKVEMLREYFRAIHIEERACLPGLPLVLDHSTPDLDRLPNFMLALANNGQFRAIKESFKAAQEAPVHPTNPGLTPVEILPVVPHID
eukprot:jgi/Mesen1/2183/ME000152S01272